MEYSTSERKCLTGIYHARQIDCDLAYPDYIFEKDYGIPQHAARTRPTWENDLAECTKEG